MPAGRELIFAFLEDGDGALPVVAPVDNGFECDRRGRLICVVLFDQDLEEELRGLRGGLFGGQTEH